MSSIPELLLWFCAVFTSVIANNTSMSTPSSSKLNCNGVLRIVSEKNHSILNHPTSGSHLNICINNGSTCCSQNAERFLHKLSVKNFDNMFNMKTDLIKRIFSGGRTKFDGFFKDLIRNSEKILDEEFIKIYKSAYATNAHITRDFYTDLRTFYNDDKPNPKEFIKNFFVEVLKKMFLLLNPGASVDIKCVGQMYDKYPKELFGEVPRTLTSQITKSLNAAKAFVQGFKYGKYVVDRIIERNYEKRCLKSITKITQCSKCSGYLNVKPCAGHCKRAYNKCYVALFSLEKVWDEYLHEMQGLANKLNTSYDIEIVANTLPLQISTGIMHYQKNNAKLSPKIEAQCAKQKRNGRSLVSDTSDFFIDNNDRVKRAPKKNDKTEVSKLASMTTQYHTHFEKLKQFWKKLPERLCDETVVANNVTDKHCWNGMNVVNNTISVQKLDNNGNGTVDNDNNDVEIQRSLNELRLAIKKLKAAISGKTPPPDDNDDDDDDDSSTNESSGSGDFSGSGSGSGSGFPDEEIIDNNIYNIENTKDEEDDTINHITEATTQCSNCSAVGNKRNNEAVSFSLSVALLIATCALQLVRL